MPCVMVERAPVLYVRWRGFEAEDLPPVVGALTRLASRTGDKVVYFSRIPADNRTFTRAEVEALLAFVRSILPWCSAIHHVIEGDGFVRSARRAIVTTLALQTERPRDFYTYATMSDAADAIASLHGVALHDLVSARGTTAPPIAPAEASERERASSAFRAAARLAVDRRRKP